MNLHQILKIVRKYLNKDVSITLLFGVLSIAFRYINFAIPGIENIQSDLRELPLIIAIIHLSKPYFSIGLSAISSIYFKNIITINLYTFGGHVIPLFILWYLFHSLEKQKFNNIKNAIASLFLVIVYYMMSFTLAFVLPNDISHFGFENFLSGYAKLFDGASFEMTYTAIAIMFYYVQYKLRLELQHHQLQLEKTVEDRTYHLHEAIEEIKTTQNYLVQSEKMASLGTLTSGVAHEINNPLNFISGGIEIIKSLKPEIEKSVTPEVNESFNLATNFINEGFNRSVDVVKALMAFSKNPQSRLEKNDIHTIIDNTLLFLRTKMPGETLVEKKYELHTLVPVYADKMHQVMINILNNAIFILNTEELKEKRIVIRTFEKGNTAVIEIFNSGPAIPEIYINQIFDPFFTTKDPDKGKGLGLSICYSIIEEHNGEITVCNLDDGVQFSILLPLNVNLDRDQMQDGLGG
ncbi:sensor histidine kinase [Carboxylicivirga caseinilyticus]|uniref:sensor histidine kinase n=1 Tax=Carboxylicivirga caseinilyticus TaxID=3417572 RepID=UPI003D33D159|nr:GHKL domain-containing protein [Marinilabiliaceae bacterium A049]